jgi:hypothetical protein
MEMGICTVLRGGMITLLMSTVVQVQLGCALMMRRGRSDVLRSVTSASRVLPGSTMPKSIVCGLATIGGRPVDFGGACFGLEGLVSGEVLESETRWSFPGASGEGGFSQPWNPRVMAANTTDEASALEVGLKWFRCMMVSCG